MDCVAKTKFYSTIVCYFYRLLKTHLQQTNFSGVSGRVLFRDGERYLPTVEIKQHFPSRVVTVGCVHPNLYGLCGKNRGCLTMNETSIYWPRGTRPTDGRSGKCCVTFSYTALFRISFILTSICCSSRKTRPTSSLLNPFYSV